MRGFGQTFVAERKADQNFVGVDRQWNKAHLGIDLNVVPGPLPEPPLIGALGEALGKLPQPLPANMSVSAIGDAKQIVITLKTGNHEEFILLRRHYAVLLTVFK